MPVLFARTRGGRQGGPFSELRGRLRRRLSAPYPVGRRLDGTRLRREAQPVQSPRARRHTLHAGRKGCTVVRIPDMRGPFGVRISDAEITALIARQLAD